MLNLQSQLFELPFTTSQAIMLAKAGHERTLETRENPRSWPWTRQKVHLVAVFVLEEKTEQRGSSMRIS